MSKLMGQNEAGPNWQVHSTKCLHEELEKSQISHLTSHLESSVAKSRQTAERMGRNHQIQG